MYFAVAKKGDKPTDGKTDVNPEGLTAGALPWCGHALLLTHALPFVGARKP